VETVKLSSLKTCQAKRRLLGAELRSLLEEEEEDEDEDEEEEDDELVDKETN